MKQIQPTTTAGGSYVVLPDQDQLAQIFERSDMAVGTAERGVYVLTDAERDLAQVIALLRVIRSI